MVKIRANLFLSTVLVYSHGPGLLINRAPFHSQKCSGLKDTILHSHPCHGAGCWPRCSTGSAGSPEEYHREASNPLSGLIHRHYE